MPSSIAASGQGKGGILSNVQYLQVTTGRRSKETRKEGRDCLLFTCHTLCWTKKMISFIGSCLFISSASVQASQARKRMLSDHKNTDPEALPAWIVYTYTLSPNRKYINIGSIWSRLCDSSTLLYSSCLSLVFILNLTNLNTIQKHTINKITKHFAFITSFIDTLFFELGLLTLVLGFLVGDLDSISRHLHLLYALVTGFPVHVWLWVKSIL